MLIVGQVSLIKRKGLGIGHAGLELTAVARIMENNLFPIILDLAFYQKG